MFINRDEQWAAFVHNGKVTEKAFTDFPSVPLAPCVTIKVLLAWYYHAFLLFRERQKSRKTLAMKISMTMETSRETSISI